MTRKTFIKGAAILGISGIIVKVLGAIFKIPLGNIVSETTMAYYGPAYYVYSLFIVIATAGLPLAISKLVAENIALGKHGEAHRVFRCSMVLMSGIGILSFIIVFFGAETIANYLHVPNAKVPIQLVSPALIFYPIMATFRGYFQGTQDMRPTAIAQVVEQVFRVVTGLFLSALFFRGFSLAFLSDDHEVLGAGGAILGDLFGSVAALAIILLIYFKRRKSIHLTISSEETYQYSTYKTVFKSIMVIAIPITIGGVLLPIMNLIEAPIINSRLLDSGMDIENATELYGIYTGYVASIVTLPQALTIALSLSLLPHISAVHKSSNEDSLKYNTTFAMRIAMLIGLPCAFGISILAKPIMTLLYPTKEWIAVEAATCLSILAVSTVFLAIVQTLNSILQGVNKPMVPVFNLLVALVIKVVITYGLVGIPFFNINGAAIGTVAAYIAAAVLSVLAIKKHLNVTFPVKVAYIWPLVASLIMSLSIIVVYRLGLFILGYSLLNNAILTLAAVAVGSLVYLVSIINIGAITDDELTSIVGKGKWLKLVNRLRFKRLKVQ